jgi:hypothetical protein
MLHRFEDLPRDLMRRAGEVSDRFEAAVRSGAAPRISAHGLRDDRAVDPLDVRVPSAWRDLHLHALSASPCKQPVCPIQLRLLQHFRTAIATPNQSPRRTSLLTAFRSARTNGIPLELCGPASHLIFPIARVVRHTGAPNRGVGAIATADCRVESSSQ